MTDRLIHRPTDGEFAHLHRLASEGSLTAAAQLPMSAWAEERRHLMTPQTIAMNAQLHRQAPEGSDVPPLFSVRVKDLPVGTEFLVRSKENGGFVATRTREGYSTVVDGKTTSIPLHVLDQDDTISVSTFTTEELS